MKFTVNMKDPDSLYDAIDRALRLELRESGLPEDEQDALLETRREKATEIAATWFEYGEYVSIEVDIEEKTARVVPVSGIRQ